MITVGIIGCGYWGPNLVRNFHSLAGVRLKAVSDLRPGRLQFIKELYPDVETTDDIESILADPEIDAVAIATPVTTHREIAERALRAGKHVFVEKPLTHTAADAWALVELAEDLGLKLAVGHIFQYAPSVRRIKREIESGTLGSIHHVSSTRINLGPPRTTVDVVWDLCPHDLSIILHLFGQMPVEVSARGRSYQWGGFVDNAHIDLTFPDGASAHIHVGWLSANKTRTLQLFAENGSILYNDMLPPEERVMLFGRGVDNRVNAKDGESVTLGDSAGDVRALELESHEPLALECAEFINAIRSGAALANDGVMGARVVELLEWISQEIAETSTVLAGQTV